MRKATKLVYTSKLYIPSTPNNSNETLCVWAEWVVFGSAKTALKFKYEIG